MTIVKILIHSFILMFDRLIHMSDANAKYKFTEKEPRLAAGQA